MKIKPKSWERFQHYKDRDPTWIKLHRKLLENFDFMRLQPASQALATLLWLLASEHPEAVIDADVAFLSFRLRWPESAISEALSPLIGKGFFEIVEFDSAPLAHSERAATPETYTAETETETSLVPLPRDGGQSRRKAQIKTEALQYLEFLNAKAGKHFRPVPSNLRLIEARLAEGVTLQDLKTLTARKCREWLGTDQEKFLRPETLCNATKCHSYLGAIPPEGSCSVPNAIAESPQLPPPAPAVGSSPNDPPADPSRIRAMASVLGRTLSAEGASTREH